MAIEVYQMEIEKAALVNPTSDYREATLASLNLPI